MANYLDTLLGRIDDQDLAAALTREVERLRDQRQFGLVFERHLPERVRLYSHPIRRGVTVQLKAETDGPVWMVQKVSKGQAHIARLEGDDQLEEKHPVSDLVVVREFGQPIYPGLKSVGKVERGGDKPFHTVINAENFHALETLLYAYEGQVDCIYIDPPYNTGARDWKYNNDYVDGADQYRHSKWLSFMEKRLRLAKRLLNPSDSVLIVTIDEKEYLRLGLLLEQVFPSARIQMVSILINPAYVARKGAFGRSDEYAYFVMLGDAYPQRVRLSREWVSSKGRTHTGNIRWDLLRRSGEGASRKDSPGCFYPIYVDPAGPTITGIGDALPTGVSVAEEREGLVAVLPIRKNGTEGRWQWSPETFRERQRQGRVKVSGSVQRGFSISILKDGEYAKVQNGEFDLAGTSPDGSILVESIETDTVLATPSTQWRVSSHDSTQYGSRLLEPLLPGRKFPFPKSLYAVEDTLRFFVSHKPDALIVDFFGGSGTTTHAVMRLNRQDGGRRRSVLITNNEVSDDEAKALVAQNHRPGMPEWEALGIFEYITKPRIAAAISGETPEGTAISGAYKFTDEFPMADGFEENVEFLELTYQDRDHVSLGHAFAAIAPLLWLKAGAQGPRIDRLPEGEPWALPADGTYGILFEPNAWRKFVKAVDKHESVRHVFVVTDAVTAFQQVLSELPAGVEATMLYEDYLSTFEINTGLGAE